MDDREVGGIRLGRSGAFRFELTDFGAVRTAVGEELLVAFCRCFIHADRLTALTDFGAMSITMHGTESAAHARNLQAMFWFAVGTLRELALAVQHLRSQLAKRGLLQRLGPSWEGVVSVETWDTSEVHRRLRDKLAFHADGPIIRAGLEGLVTDGAVVVVAVGDGPEAFKLHLNLGLEAAMRGLAIEQSEMAPIIKTASEHQQVSGALQQVFREVLGLSGLKRGPARPVNGSETM